MKYSFTLEYWIENGWYVGKLKEIPGVFSQGKTLEELEEYIKDAYKLMFEDIIFDTNYQKETKEILIDVA